MIGEKRDTQEREETRENTNEEEIIKIENILETMKTRPENLRKYMHVKVLGGGGEEREQCVVCKVLIMDNMFSVFCSKCLFSEDDGER